MIEAAIEKGLQRGAPTTVTSTANAVGRANPRLRIRLRCLHRRAPLAEVSREALGTNLRPRSSWVVRATWLRS